MNDLKMFVWEDVLWDYSHCLLALVLITGIACEWPKVKSAWRDLKKPLP